MAKVINHFIPKPPNLGTTTLTENGTYKASNDGLDGYSQVSVNVPTGGDGGWQPDPLWTDIRALWDEDTLRKKVASGKTFYSDTALSVSVGTLASSHPVTSVTATYGTIVGDGTDGTSGTTYYVAIADVTGTYIYSAIYLIAGAEEVTTLAAGSIYKSRRYITSDGYDSGETLLSGGYNSHTWDESKDIIDSKGARIRWLKIYANEQGSVWNFNHSIIWAIHNITTSISGDSRQYATGFNHSYALQRIELESNVTSIGNYGLITCPSLQSVIIPSSVTSIGNNAFSNCSSLQSVVIHSGVTSIGTSAFSGCQSLVSITIPTSAATIASNAFANCFSLQNVVLGANFDTSITINAGNTNPARTNLSRQAINAMIAAYKDNSGEGGTARTLTIGATNLAKLTAEDIAVATAKNLTLA